MGTDLRAVWNNVWTGEASLSKGTDDDLGHTDEIEKHDNLLPHRRPELLWLTVALLLAQGGCHRSMGDRSQQEALTAETASAGMLMTDEAVLAGEEIYAENCSACHGTDLEGGIGPSFLDDSWIYGRDPETVIRVISLGATDNGMLAWESILSPQQINQVAAYVLRTNQEQVER